ncbi:TPA: hypothetical protein PAW90_002828, partial [Staphylococcus aureus]|nr:hypothetical protein [Staphylococcus aureus]HDD2603111.1 hypothetical protein [Staphylococcus aureus]HDD3659557.1 hypothetical protein [Staphylococcus aureus]HDD3753067.1 hypothetical protein [Staphylococcus aureus]HDD3808094.1 hypothetical protein [Staphylococcus aureus]
KILGRVLATDIDIAKIRDYFIDYHGHTISERSLADKAIDVIIQFVALNYGHVLPLVAKYLINREDEVIQWFYKEVDWFEAKLKDDKSNTGNRMFKRYAVITTSA